jgi:lipoprotein-anchoring transpeptidase ErfK/SrfK
MRRAVMVCAGAVTLLVVLAGCDAGAFQVRAAGLERSWSAWQAKGLPASSLAPARARLARIESGRSGPIPYPIISAALVEDPLASVERMGERAHAGAVVAARARAEAELAELRRVGGPNYEPALEDHVLELGRAREPVDFDRLAAAWRHEASVLRQEQGALAAAAGGLSGGLPTDVVEATLRLHALAAQLQALGLPSGGDDAVVDSQTYLRLPYGQMLRAHGSVLTELQGALGRLQGRMDTWSGARHTLSSAQDLMPDLESLGAGKDFEARLAQAEAALGAAHSDQSLAQAAQGAKKLLADMQAAQEGSLPVQSASVPCVQGAPVNLIVVHLATQELDAYTDGCPWLRTPVTTGRPALPTDRGTFQIFAKYPQYHMVSPWPKSSPFYYPPTWVSDAMEFVHDGTFIHGASWQPNGTYGLGSQNGPYASHGCVHVMPGPLQQLYDWAPIGTTVQVTD